MTTAVSAAHIATGFEDGRIEIATRAGRELLFTFSAPRSVTALAISPDGRVLAAAGYDFLRLWDLHSGSAAAREITSWGRPRALAFSPDGKWIAIAIESPVIYVYEVATGGGVRWFGEHSGYGTVMEQQSDFEWRPAEVLAIAFSPGGRRLAVGSEDGLYVHDFDAKTTVRDQRAGSEQIVQVAFASETKVVWSAAKRG